MDSTTDTPTPGQPAQMIDEAQLKRYLNRLRKWIANGRPRMYWPSKEFGTLNKNDMRDVVRFRAYHRLPILTEEERTNLPADLVAKFDELAKQIEPAEVKDGANDR